MTNPITSVDNLLNQTGYINGTYTQPGEHFSNVLRTKMNTEASSIATFKDDEDKKNNSFSLTGSKNNSSLFGAGMTSGIMGDSYNSFFSNLFGSAVNDSSQGGIDSKAMLAMIFLTMAMNSADSGTSHVMMSSLSNALTDKYSYLSSAYKANQSKVNRDMPLSNSTFKSTYVTPGTGSYPSSMGKPCSASIVSNVGSRSANAYRSVIEQFNVETNSRYTPYKNGSTYCNIYVWDVTTAMGAEIPHRTDSNGDIAKPGDKNITYMTANKMYDWLLGKGKEYGWKEVSAQEAQRYANMGCPAVTAWKNPKGHGHIQMVAPSKDGQYNQSKGVAISQAGSKVIEYGYISDVYKSTRLKDIKYFVHA